VSVVEEHPRRIRGGGRGDVVLVVVLIAAALLVVLTIVLVAAGGERSRQGPRGAGALDAVENDVRAAGLVVCSRSDVPDPRGAAAVASRTLLVAVECASGETALVQVDQFADEQARDAAARSLEGLVRPRGSASVRTYGDLTITVRGTSDDAVAERLDAALIAAGAR
jgi:hypothetical protein